MGGVAPFNGPALVERGEPGFGEGEQLDEDGELALGKEGTRGPKAAPLGRLLLAVAPPALAEEAVLQVDHRGPHVVVRGEQVAVPNADLKQAAERSR